MNTGIYLLLGTNLGDRIVNLYTARQLISSRIGHIITTSSIYQTAAWGNTQQPDFYNQVIEIETTLPPEDTLTAALQIEADMGRIRTEKWGARLIDIDILFWNDLVLQRHNLTIPHPGITNRKFTLIPLAEISPEFKHPLFSKTNAELLLQCNDDLDVQKVESL